MTDKAYAYMDWPRIEDIIYAEMNHPGDVMAPKRVKEGTIYQCFCPGAKSAVLIDRRTGKRYPMFLEDENGYFAVLVGGRRPAPHDFEIDGTLTGDPYAYSSVMTEEAASRFSAGISERVSRWMGAHVMEVDGTKGVYFALWAPNAFRVSVVGPFDEWDGRRYPMNYHEESGIFDLFIPYLEEGTEYAYELKLKDGLVYTRPDPFGTEFILGDRPSSVVGDLRYRWHDRDYLEMRNRRADTTGQPIAIYECRLAEWAKKETEGTANYRTLAPKIASHAKALGYTHIELTPVMEYPDDKSNGYQTAGYYAPTSRYGTPADFKYFIDTLHGENIGVILDWTPAQFSADTRWMASFDGTCLFEHLDPRQGVHPVWGSKLYNYGRPQVRSFLISNAVFWMREYHADGLRLDGCSSMLRNDYERADGQWVANIYGSAENLEGIDFLSNLSAVFKKRFPDGLLIMEEHVDWPDTTAPSDEDGLGFDYKWNLHFTRDVLSFLAMKEEDRKKNLTLLQNGMLNHFFEHYMISLSRTLGPFSEETFLEGVDGDTPEKRMALARLAYVFLFTHPGKKLLTEGEDVNTEFFRALLRMYAEEPALSKTDYSEAGFEWVNTTDTENGVLTFIRRGIDRTDTLLVAVNTSEEAYDQYQAGVPYPGRYKEIFNSDDKTFGGSGDVNPRARSTRHEEKDERADSLRFRIAARSAAVFRYQGE